MSNQGGIRKNVRFGIFAAIVVLTMVLCMVMAGCGKEQPAAVTTTAPAADTGSEAVRYDLYWNVDRDLYDGKSEAGMSSREPAEDGFFYVRFFKDGEIVELRVADRKTINAMEVWELMGLEFDENGIVIGIIPVDDMPIEQIAWQFYVQSVGGNVIKANSSTSMNGMEVMIEVGENTGIYDLSGVTGEIGVMDKPTQGDRIMVVGDNNGNITHVFVYERPNYMLSHEGYCQHCEKDVTWLEWSKAKALPTTSGHYQLVADLKDVPQQNILEDQKICFDLNGHRVDGASGRRIWSMHNAGTELALMDTSEAQTGRIAAHGQGDQGLCVWVRYGVFYMYGGILDGSDATTIKNGTTLNMGNNTYMYMYGGELIGGTSKPTQSANGKWSAGIAGTMQVNNGSKFVMYDGLIHKGKAVGVVTKYDADGQPASYSAGVGGNIVINGGIMEMHGGTIRDGYARQAGNIHMQGKGEFYFYGGLISNGRCYGKGANGGNIYVGGNNIFYMSGGTIRNGRTYNCAGNVYFQGTFRMTGGIITDGKCINWTTRKVNSAAASRNLFGVQGDFYMYGGRVAGGVQMVDSDGAKNQTTILVSARSVIFDEDGTGPHLTLSDTSGGSKCVMYVGQLHDEAKIGISKVQAAVFTEPTEQNNLDNFVSDIAGVDISWSEDGLVMGEVHCMCSKDTTITTHKPGCDGVQYAWSPWNGTSMPSTTGNYYLISDLKLTGGATIPDNATVRVDLNGHTAAKNDKYRIWSFLNAENSSLSITDTSAEQDGVISITYTAGDFNQQGGIFWSGLNNATYVSRNNTINLLAGTLDATNYKQAAGGVAICLSGGDTTFNMYGGTVKGGETVKDGSSNKHGGSIYVDIGCTFNMYDGLVTGGRAHSGGGQGGNLVVRGTMNMYGGTVKDGNYDHASTDSNIRIFGSSADSQATLNMYGGTIAGGIDCNTAAVACTIYVSGNAVIDKNLTSSGCEKPTLSLRGGSNYGGVFKPVEIGEMTSGASIYVTPVQAAFSTVTKPEYTQYFHAEADGVEVAYVDDPASFGVTDADMGKLFIGHVHCICGGSIESGTKLPDGTVHICKNVAFTPAESLSHISANTNIYLTKDVVLTGQIQTRGAYTLNVCLHGHNITGANKNRMFRSITNGDTEQPTDDSAINITTCDASYTDGQTDKNCLKPVASAACTQEGGVILSNKGTFTLYRGTIDASGYTVKDGKNGAAIKLGGTGKFVQYPNTTVIGGYATNGKSEAHGGAVMIGSADAVYTMLGGTIRDGMCHKWGGNLYITEGTFNMYDGVIKDGYKKPEGGSIDAGNMNGNITLREKAVFNMMGGTIYGKITSANDEVIKNFTISGSAKIIFSDDEATQLKGNNLRVDLIVPTIGTLNPDARIGMFYQKNTKGNDIKVATLTDPESVNLENLYVYAYYHRKEDRTFGLKIVGNELYLYETTGTE